MAENINLVGNFTDNISPKLRKLNRELNNVTKSFTKLGGKIRPVTKEMGKLAMATDRVALNLKSQRQSLTATTQALRSYTTASRKATSQQKKLKPTTMRPPRGGGGRGGGGGGGMGIGMGFALGGVGLQLSQLVTTGIIRGFEMGVGLLQKPFQFLANGIGERIEDEMSDIKAAGGIYAITKRMKNPFIKSFAEAESLTKETNRYLAELAGALPGDTQDYINVAKQISDSIGQIIAKDEKGSLKLGRELAEKRGASTAAFDAGGAGATKAAYKEMVGELTKQTVLASGGSKMGAMGLPQLTERMISSDNLTTGMFRRYSAVFRDPQIMSALERNIAEINKTAKSSSERYEAIQKMYEEVVTPEYVRRVQRSTQGVLEALKTTFMNPEVGLLGLGRPIELAGDASNKLSIKFDQFGRMLDKNNEVTTDVSKAARESLSVFEYLRDIFANVMIVLQPLIDSITSLFDPFKELGLELDKIRLATMKFQNVYELANASLDKVIKGLPKAAQANMKATKGMRASLMAVTSAFREFGVFTDKQATDMYNTLLSESTTVKELQGLVSKFIDLFLNSAAGAKVGSAMGTIIGKVLKTFADLIVSLFGDATVKSEFVQGFVAGFNDAGGKKAITDIFNLVFDKIKDLIYEIVTTFPKESALFAGLALGPLLLPAIPGIISSLFSAIPAGGIGAAIAGGFSAILASPALIAAVVAGLAITAKATEGPRKSLTDNLASSAQSNTGKAGIGAQGLLAGVMGELTWVIHDFVKGFGDIFTGLYNIVVGAFTDPAMVTQGINQIFSGLWSLFTMIGHAIIAIGYAVPGLILIVINAIKNLFLGIVGAIAQAGANAWASGTAAIGGAIAGLWAKITSALSNINPLNWFKGGGGGGTPTESRGGGRASSGYRGNTTKTMSLGSAISSEMKNKPAGSHLVIANSSEAVIPAASGYMPPGTGGGGNVSLSGVTINVSGVQDPKAIANVVAEEILYAVQKNTYKEIYTT